MSEGDFHEERGRQRMTGICKGEGERGTLWGSEIKDDGSREMAGRWTEKDLEDGM